MKIQGFITSYKAENGNTHIFFYPGQDEHGKPYLKMSFSSKDIDYLFTKHSDNAFDYNIIESTSEFITCHITNTLTNKKQTYTIRLE